MTDQTSASTGAVHLDEGTFDSTLESAGDKPVLVDFFAEWCGPCKMAAPIIDEMADEYREQGIVIAKVDVDQQGALAQRYGVMSIPTVIVFKNGEEVQRQTGFAGKQGYVNLLEAAMK